MLHSASYLALFALAFSALPLHASSTVVPDNFATIQLAIDSGADTVVVKGGTYSESVTATAALVLLAFEPAVQYGNHFQLPTLDGLSTTHPIVARGFRFREVVTIAAPGGPMWPECVFESCRFDAGMSTGSPIEAYLYVRGCTFLANSQMDPHTCEFINNAFIGAHLDLGYEGFATFQSNVFSGAGDFGLRVNANDGGLTFEGNLVTDKANGLEVVDPLNAEINDNVVADCTGNGVHATHSGVGVINCYRNEILRCGGHGIYLQAVGGEFGENVIDNVGGNGIHMANLPVFLIRGNDIRAPGGYGIRALAAITNLLRNRIYDAGIDGVYSPRITECDSNIVARAGGNGIRITLSNGTLFRNTVYSCTGDGFSINSTNNDMILNNIGYANGGVGFAFTGTGTPTLACNDWYANAGGPTSGVAPGGSDLSDDPLFCDVANDDVSLSSISPLINPEGCGQVGALGGACDLPVSVAPVEEEAFGVRVFPHPSRSHVTFAWPAGEGETRVEIFDVTGARRWSTTAMSGARQIVWRFEDSSGSPLAPGIYLARFERAGVVYARKVSLTP